MADRRRGRTRGKRPARRASPAAGERRTLTIDRLGGAGDGMAGDVAVPFALPGEVVTASVGGKKGRVLSVDAPSPLRAAPPCRHFGLPGDGCGGCKMQHLARDDYAAWKAARLTATLERAGLILPPLARFASPPRSRRRAKLAFLRRGGRVAPGFRALASDRVVSIEECHVLTPALFALAEALPPLIEVLQPAAVTEVMVTMTHTGADVDVLGQDDRALDLGARSAAVRLAERLDLDRLSVSGVPVAERREPTLSLGGVDVTLPPGAFLQATAEGQAQLTALVEEGVGDAARIADLFCGVGTFALPLSRRASVLAVEGEGASVQALARAAKAAGRPVTAEVRDLFTRPMQPEELAGMDAVILDPPRAGAQAQCEALVRSGVPRIVYVSCAPDALARDLTALSACYDLTTLSLVDQFVWSPHIEAAAVLTRRV